MFILLQAAAAIVVMLFNPIVVPALIEQQPDRQLTLKPFTVSDSITMTHIVDPYDGSRHPHPRVSPNGKRFLVVTEKGDLTTNLREYCLFVYSSLAPLSTPRKVAVLKSSSNRPGIKDAEWLDNDRITFIGENPRDVPQLYAVMLHNGRIEKLTADPHGVTDYSVSSDLQTVAYYATWHGDKKLNEYKEDHGFAVSDEGLAALMNGEWKTQLGVYQLYIVNRSTHQTLEVKAEPFRSARHQVWLSADGRYAITEQPAFKVDPKWGAYNEPFIRAGAQEDTSSSQDIRSWSITQAMIVDTKTAQITPVLNSPVHYFSVAWSPDSRSAFLAGVYMPLNTTDPEELAKRKCCTVAVHVQIPSLRSDTVATIPENEVWQLTDATRKDSVTAKIYKIAEGDVYSAASSVVFSKSNNTWDRIPGAQETKSGSNITVSQSINQRPRLIVVGSGTRPEKVILDPNPQFDHLQFGRAEVVRWEGKRGEKLVGGFIYPVGYKPGVHYPLVIQTHGFDPEIFLLDGPFTTAMAAQELSNKGIAVLQLGESPLYDQAARTLEFGPVQLSQYESAIDYLDGMGLIDRQKVGLVGFSITGFAVRYALIHSRYPFAAATSAEGNDFGYWQYVAWSHSPQWVSQSEAPYGGPPWSGSWKKWVEAAIDFNYDKIHTPLRLESDNNPGEVIGEWENFFALRRLQRPVELIYIPHGYHPVYRPWDRLTSQEGNVDWMVFWLKGEEDPDISKREQYHRWRRLRELQNAEVKSYSPSISQTEALPDSGRADKR